MLRINRRSGERIIITCGEHKVVLSVDEIALHGKPIGATARLSFGGSRDIKIDREEVYELRKGKR